MKAEADIANFIGVPDCIIYSQAFSTISSVIPAFSKRGDIIVADKSVNYAIRKGIEISRSTVYWYEHNNLEDLERVLADVEKTQKRKKKLTRRFIVTEGLFEKSGDIVDLPKIVCFWIERQLLRLTNRAIRSSSSTSTSSASSSTKPGLSLLSVVLAVA
jgi:serine palmitoyltransferase